MRQCYAGCPAGGAGILLHEASGHGLEEYFNRRRPRLFEPDRQTRGVRGLTASMTARSESRGSLNMMRGSEQLHDAHRKGILRATFDQLRRTSHGIL